jgi:DNA (cytosine-5)-methyltransferase 1
LSIIEESAPGASDRSRDRALPRVLELFAGAGGMALGMHRAGFEIVDLVERDAASCKTLRENADHLGLKNPDQITPRDVRNISYGGYGRPDLLCAGAPCQPFSRGGERRGRNDERNMLGEVVTAVALTRPRAFVIENVRGLLFDSQIRYLKSIVARLRRPTVEDPSTPGCEDLYHERAPGPGPDDDYAVQWKVLDAADFGLAQRRPRLFIVGISLEEKGTFSWPEETHFRSDLVEDLRDGIYWNGRDDVSEAARKRAVANLPIKALSRGGKRWRTLRDLTEDLGPPTLPGYRADDPCHVLVRGARLYGTKHTGSPIDWVSKTVKAGVHGTPGGEHIIVKSPGNYRYLTVRECAALQGFPADYVLPEKRTPAMRQLGNAVPVALAEAVGYSLKVALDPPVETHATRS